MPLAGRYHGLGYRRGGGGIDHIIGGDFPYAVDLVVEETPMVALVPVGTLVVIRDTLPGMSGVQVPSKPVVFEIRKGDRLPPYLVDALDKDANPIDLSGQTAIVFSMRDRSTNVLKISQVAGSLEEGGDGATFNRMRYDWQATDTDTVGQFEGEFELTFSPGVKRSFPASEKQTLIIQVHDDISAT